CARRRSALRYFDVW
nr:immunoglobulin heavy chain junction region [Mus musculus]